MVQAGRDLNSKKMKNEEFEINNEKIAKILIVEFNKKMLRLQPNKEEAGE